MRDIKAILVIQHLTTEEGLVWIQQKCTGVTGGWRERRQPVSSERKEWRGEERGEGGYPELCAEIPHKVKFFWLSTFHDQFEEPNYFFQDYVLHIQPPISWQGCGHSGFLPSCDISSHEPKSKETGAEESLLDWSSYCWLMVGASYRPIDEAQKTPRLCHQA